MTKYLAGTLALWLAAFAVGRCAGRRADGAPAETALRRDADTASNVRPAAPSTATASVRRDPIVLGSPLARYGAEGTDRDAYALFNAVLGELGTRRRERDADVRACFDGHVDVGSAMLELAVDVHVRGRQAVIAQPTFVMVQDGVAVPDTVGACVARVLTAPTPVTATLDTEVRDYDGPVPFTFEIVF